LNMWRRVVSASMLKLNIRSLD